MHGPARPSGRQSRPAELGSAGCLRLAFLRPRCGLELAQLKSQATAVSREATASIIGRHGTQLRLILSLAHTLLFVSRQWRQQVADDPP